MLHLSQQGNVTFEATFTELKEKKIEQRQKSELDTPSFLMGTRSKYYKKQKYLQ